MYFGNEGNVKENIEERLESDTFCQQPTYLPEVVVVDRVAVDE